MEYVTVTNCPLCGFPGSQDFDRRVFRNFPVENRLCMYCGLVYQSPRMSEDALTEFYTAEYRLTYQNKEGPTKKDIFVQQNRAKSLADYLQKNISKPIEPVDYLDIGSSTGALLDYVCQMFSLQGVGVEPGEAYRTYALKQGLEVYDSMESLPQPEDRLFGMISLIHVLEHLSDPVDYLVQLRRKLLAPNGILLVEVPNLYAHDSFEVAHLVSFSEHTLKETLYKAGYMVKAFHSHGAPRSKLLPLYLTVLAAPALNIQDNRSILPEKKVKRKRQLGMLRRRVVERLANRLAWLPIPQG